MKNSPWLASLLLVAMLCPGCLGLVVVHPKQQTLLAVSLGPRGTILPQAPDTALTTSDVQTAWGIPDARRSEPGDVTVWTYRGSYYWGVVIPMYLIPVPVPFPAGHRHTDLYFKDDRVFKASWTIDGRTGACLGPEPQCCLLCWNKDGDK